MGKVFTSRFFHFLSSGLTLFFLATTVLCGDEPVPSSDERGVVVTAPLEDRFTVEFEPDIFQRTMPRAKSGVPLEHAVPLGIKHNEKERVTDDEKGAAPNMTGLVLWTFLIIMFIVGGLWMLKRMFPNSRFLSQGGMINILARKQLPSKNSIVLVEIGRKVFLLADTKDSVVNLGVFSDADTVAAIKSTSPAQGGESVEKSFREALNESIVTDGGEVSSEAAPEGETAGEGVEVEEKEKLDRLFDEVDYIRKTVKDWRNHFA